MKKRVIFVLLFIFSVFNAKADQTVIENGVIYLLAETSAAVVGVTESCPANVKIPKSIQNKPVKHIKNFAFDNCNNIEFISIPSSVDSIDATAFFDCVNLKEVVIEDGAKALKLSRYNRTNLSPLLFQGCPLDELYLGRNITGDLTIPYNTDYSSIFGSYIQGHYSPTVSQITIGDSVTSISAGLFAELSSLKTFNMGKQIRSIEYEGLYHFPLSNIIFPECLDSIGEKALEGSALQRISFPKETRIIGKEAFKNCSTLEEISLGENIVTIGEEAFSNCTKLKKVIIPNSVENIGTSAFFNCSDLHEFVLGKGLKKLCHNFFQCNKLEQLFIPNNIDTIVNIGAPLKKLIIEDGTTPVTFEYSLHYALLDTLYIGRDFHSGGNYSEYVWPFAAQKNLSSLKFGPSVTTIPSYAFIQAGIIELNVSEPICSIGKFAFDECEHLKYIILPKTLQLIEDYAFDECDNIKEITSWSQNPPTIGPTTFNEKTQNTAMLLVPIGSAAAYSAAPYWENFNSIIEIDASGLPEKNVLKSEVDSIWSLEGKRQNGTNILKGIYIINRKKMIK